MLKCQFLRTFKYRRYLTIAGCFIMASLLCTNHLATENIARRSSAFVNVGGENVEALLHRKLHRMKHIIYDTEDLYSYISDNITSMQQLNFLPSTKTPCFLSNERIAYEENSKWYSGSRISVSCLPFFYLIGFQKCGTSDFYMRVLQHKDVTDADGRKEPHFWKRSLSFGNYTNMFRRGSSEIVRRAGGLTQLLSKDPASNQQPVNFESDASFIRYHNEWNELLLGDFSATTVYIPREKIEALYRLTPKAKIIIMMRNPSERALSHYLMDIKYGTTKGRGTAKEFHIYCEHLIACINAKGNQMESSDINTGCRGDWILTNGIYHAFIRKWLQIFPRQSILFVKFEEYIQQPSRIFRNNLFPLLELSDLTESEVNSIDTHWINNQGTSKVQMFARTKRMLDDFYRPHNRWLVDLIGDEKFSWIQL